MPGTLHRRNQISIGLHLHACLPACAHVVTALEAYSLVSRLLARPWSMIVRDAL